MLPVELQTQQFESYPPEARKLAMSHLAALRPLPLSFLPSFLRELIDYDFKFPAERRALEKELENLSSLSASERAEWFSGFLQIKLSRQLEDLDWVNAPSQFVEQLSAHLWTTHQVDAFRAAADDYANRLRSAVPVEQPAMARLGIAVIGQGVDSYPEPLFRKLRPHGAYFSQVSPEDGLRTLLNAVAARVAAHPLPYAHWYIDGGQQAEHDAAVTCVSYHALEPMRNALLRRMHAEIDKAGMGPERLRTVMAQLRPADLAFTEPGDPILDRFQLKLLTEGSGTQVYSTTFAQWAARESLRRAQPLTLLVRFAPRQRQKPMNEMLTASLDSPQLDPLGSLVDGDMGAYYNWLNQQRLPGAEQSSFIAWFEQHGQAVVIGPTVPRGTESAKATDMKGLLSWVS